MSDTLKDDLYTLGFVPIDHDVPLRLLWALRNPGKKFHPIKHKREAEQILEDEINAVSKWRYKGDRIAKITRTSIIGRMSLISFSLVFYKHPEWSISVRFEGIKDSDNSTLLPDKGFRIEEIDIDRSGQVYFPFDHNGGVAIIQYQSYVVDTGKFLLGACKFYEKYKGDDRDSLADFPYIGGKKKKKI